MGNTNAQIAARAQAYAAAINSGATAEEAQMAANRAEASDAQIEAATKRE